MCIISILALRLIHACFVLHPSMLWAPSKHGWCPKLCKARTYMRTRIP